jgi:hypothetical protein
MSLAVNIVVSTLKIKITLLLIPPTSISMFERLYTCLVNFKPFDDKPNFMKTK